MALHSLDRRAAQIATTITLVLLVAAVAFALEATLGRAGERVAVQLLVQLCAVLSLALFSGNSGIISFGHVAFLGLGAYLSGILTMPAALQRSVLRTIPPWIGDIELGFIESIGVVAVVGALVGLVVGLPLSRLREASATIATLALLIIMHSVLIGARDFTRGAQTFYGVPRVTDFDTALTAALLFVVVSVIFRESRAGLRLRSVRDNEPAAQALGIDPRRARLVAFVLSAALATVAGALYGHMLGAFSPRDFYFTLTFSMVAMLIVGGLTTVSGAVVGVIGLTLLGDLVRQLEGGVVVAGVQLPQVFGLTTLALAVAILLVIWLRPDGLMGRRELALPGLARLVSFILARSGSGTATLPTATKVPPRTLEANSLSRRFEGLIAVDDASFRVPPATITGLIGPNGAGKSTLVNLLSGQLTPSDGRMHLGDVDLGRNSAHGIARLGLTRTFQNNRLFERLTVFENVLVAAQSGRDDARHGQRAAAVALRELRQTGLDGQLDALAASLPYGDRKRLEIARCLALAPSLILLDEPAAGLDDKETQTLGQQLARLCAERGIALLLIDHDLEFVNRLSSNVLVMNRGRIIASGTPAEIRTDPAVIEAYIGRGRAVSPAPTISRSDRQLSPGESQ